MSHALPEPRPLLLLHTLPGWARAVIYICGGIAAAAIQLGSSWSLGSLAMHAGLGMPRALLLPVALDLGAIVAGCLWVAGDRRQRVTGRWATISLVLASISFNAADSLATHGKLNPDQLLYISVGIAMIFPLTAALMGHIVLLVRESDSAAQAGRALLREERAAQSERAERDRAADLERIQAEAQAKVAVAAAEGEAQAKVAAARAAASDSLGDSQRASRVTPAVAKRESASVKDVNPLVEKLLREEPKLEDLVAGLAPGRKGEQVTALLRDAWNAGIDLSGTNAARLVGCDRTYGTKAVAALKAQGFAPSAERLHLAAVGNN